MNNTIFSGSFKTFENLFTQWRMFFKMTVFIGLALLAVHIGLMSLVYRINPNAFYGSMEPVDRCIFRTYVEVSVKKTFSLRDLEVAYSCEKGNVYSLSSSYFFGKFGDYFKNVLRPYFLSRARGVAAYTSPIYLLYFLIIYLFAKFHEHSTADKFKRGKQLVDEEKFSKLLKEISSGFCIRINERIHIPETIVNKHIFAIGATGSGKSQLAFRIVQQLIDRGVRCVIHDFKGDFIPVFYDPKKHYIFNPLDQRHMGLMDQGGSSPRGWTIFNELSTMPNVDSFTSSMIPDGQGDKIWYTAPRDLLKAMIIYCVKKGKRTNADLLDMIETDPVKLREMFASMPGCRVGLKHLEEQKLAGQFMSILATYTAPLSYLSGTDGDFSIRQWIADEKSEKRVIFVANQAEVQKTLRTLITCFFDFSTKALCTLPDDPQGRRIYFILDEFGQLSKMESVVQLLTQGRSKGGAAMLLIQDSSQIDAIYGRELSSSIVNGCRNRFYFNVSDHNTADFISKAIGSQEMERTKESKSFGVHDMKDSISINSEIVERPLVMSSEVTAQKNLTFYLQISDIPEVAHIAIDYMNFKPKVNPYVPRDMSIESYGEKEESDKKKREEINKMIESDLTVLPQTKSEIEGVSEGGKDTPLIIEPDDEDSELMPEETTAELVAQFALTRGVDGVEKTDDVISEEKIPDIGEVEELTNIDQEDFY